MNTIIRFLLTGLAVLLSSYLLPGIHIDGYGSALIVALVLAVANFLVRPVLIIFTIPLTLITLGLFLLVINAIIILVVDYFVPGFSTDGFWWAMLFSLVLSVFNSLFADLSKENKD
jgi:putative membrane protein